MAQHILASITQFASCTFLLCAALLWMRRRGNRSRIFFSLAYALCGVDLYLRILSLYNGVSFSFEALQPAALYMALIEIPIFLFYLIEIVNPGWLDWRKMTLLCLPWLAWNVVLLIPGMQFRPLDLFGDLFPHLGEPNVWVRLLFVLLILPYNTLIYLIPHNWQRSSADRRLIRIYGGGFIVMALLFVGSSVSGEVWVSGLHLAYGTLFCFLLAYYELFVRLQVPSKKALPPAETPPSSVPSHAEETEACYAAICRIAEKTAAGQWSKIARKIEDQRLWRNPDMTLTDWANLLQTNRTTLARLFQEQGYSGGYKEFVNRRRIAEFLELMRQRPDMNIQDAFFEVGYRSRMTALRHFKEYVGCRPSEYLHPSSDDASAG